MSAGPFLLTAISHPADYIRPPAFTLDPLPLSPFLHLLFTSIPLILRCSDLMLFFVSSEGALVAVLPAGAMSKF